MDDSCPLDASMMSPSLISIHCTDLGAGLLAPLHGQNAGEIVGGQLGLQPPTSPTLIGRLLGSAPPNLTISHVIREGPPFRVLGWLGPSQKQLGRWPPNQGMVTVINFFNCSVNFHLMTCHIDQVLSYFQVSWINVRSIQHSPPPP
jgi:hypothetical protein